MVLESIVICIDNSDFMRNGDFPPTRFEAQQDAVDLVCHSKLRSNPENNFALLSMAKVQVLATFTTNITHILSKLYRVELDGDINLATGIKIAQLVLKHRQGLNHRMRIIAFVGSPVSSGEEELVKLARKLKKEKVNVDIVNFGEEEVNTEILSTFINTLNGESGSGNNLLTVPVGFYLYEALFSSPIIQIVDGTGSAGPMIVRSQYSIDLEDDPELALALRISMEEEMRRQEEARKIMEIQTPESKIADQNEKAILQGAPEISIKEVTSSSGTIVPRAVQSDDMTEDEQVAFIMNLTIPDSGNDAKNKTNNVDNSADANDPEITQYDLENSAAEDPLLEDEHQVTAKLEKNKDEPRDKEKN